VSWTIVGTCQKCEGPVCCSIQGYPGMGQSLPVPMCYGCGAIAKDYGRVLGMGEPSPSWTRLALPLPMRVARGEAEWPSGKA
jgi:hypothetical protein